MQSSSLGFQQEEYHMPPEFQSSSLGSQQEERHMPPGRDSRFRFCVAHAVYCVGCCWLLMLTGFAIGVMNMIWMGLLTLFVPVEKLAPRGERIAAVSAAALILWGTALSPGIPLAKP
jgi:predicted metal-binding membrane protein